MPFRKINAKTSKDTLKLLSEVINVVVFTVVSEVKRTELRFDYPVFGEDANVDDKTMIRCRKRSVYTGWSVPLTPDRYIYASTILQGSASSGRFRGE